MPKTTHLSDLLKPYEREIIREALLRNHGHRQATADELGINRTTLFKKMREHGLADVGTVPMGETVLRLSAITGNADWSDVLDDRD